MKPFLAILGREIAERKLLFLGAVLASLFPLVVPWLPGLSSQTPEDLRGGVALALALITTSLFALILGTTVIARDLSEGRIGFYFARPVPGWALWAGKLLSAALLSLGSGALILLTSWMAGANVDFTGYWGSVSSLRAVSLSSPFLFICAVLGALILVVLGHAASVMVRSRSPWLGVDLAAFAVVVTTFWSGNRRLELEGAYALLGWGQICFAAIALCAISLAGLVQVLGGRTDLRRGHRLLSITLWTLVGAATLAHVIYVQWALRVTPGDLVKIQNVQPAPAGSWIALKGYARNRGGYTPTFLLDTASGQSVQLPGSPPSWWIPPLFTPDGSRAFWFERAAGGSRDLWMIDLWSPKPALRRSGVSASGEFEIEPSPDGHRLAVLSRGRLTVEDLDARRILASASIPGRPGVFFLGKDRVRVVCSVQEDEPGMPELWRLITLDLDVSRNRLRPVSRIELPGDRWGWRLSPDGRRAILLQPDSKVSLIADLETGRTISVPNDRSLLHFLTDGRLVRVSWEGTRSVLALLTPEGQEQLRAPLPRGRLQFGTNLSPDLLVIATSGEGPIQKVGSWTSWILDLKTGGLQKIGSGMVPAVEEARTGSPAAHLVYRDTGGLAFFDPETGQFRTVLQGTSVEPGLWLARPWVMRSQFR